jgi:hypothetical protein
MAEVMEMEVFKSGRPGSFLEFFPEVPLIPFLELLRVRKAVIRARGKTY